MTDPALPGFIDIEVDVNSSDSPDTVANETATAITAAISASSATVVNNIVSVTIPTASTIPDEGPSTSTTLGPYIYDTSQGFTIGGGSTTLTADVNGESSHVILVGDSSNFTSTGYLIFGYGTEAQEGPIPYIAVPDPTSILLSPAYSLQMDHPIGTSVLSIATTAPVILPSNGSSYEPFLTDTASGRVYAQNLIDSVTAAGVTVIYTILYPNDIGLGGWESPTPSANEVSIVYGP